MKSNLSIRQVLGKDCCGCYACGDICPKKCISFIKGPDGFIYPDVDEDICVGCGLCSNVCPSLHISIYDSASFSYAVYAKDDIKRSLGSSGSVFSLLAEQVLTCSGRVWGAAFDENLYLVHQKADKYCELLPLLKSKYIQSDLREVYKQISQDLKNNIKTLFCGSPCQCSALKNYVKIGVENLIVVDFVCHGVPSHDLFMKSIEWYEKRHKVQVESFVFRYKGKAVKHPQSYACVHKNDKKIYHGLHYQFPYYFGFQKYITLRESCYNCNYAIPNRSGDITLGDFWGIEKYVPSLNAKAGVSMVLCNTEKGHLLFDSLLQNELIHCHKLPMEYAVLNNGCLSKPSTRKPEREVLFKHLAELPFDEVVKLHLVPRRKWIFDLYYGMPAMLRKIVRIIMDKRMKYE